MINFFRKFRKQLADDNKPLKYMRYAVGEIVLVVIGILIALSINNWNEKDKAKSEGKVLLALLKQDLHEDIIYFKSLRTEYNGWLNQIENILTNVLDGKTEKINRLDQYAAGRSSLNYVSVNKITFLEMFNSGKNIEFNNQEIIRNIKDHFQYTDIVLRKLNSDNDVFFQQSMKFYGVQGVNTYQRLKNNRNLEYIDWSWLKNPRSSEYINLEAIMLYYKLAIEANLDVMIELEKKSSVIIDQIAMELEVK